MLPITAFMPCQMREGIFHQSYSCHTYVDHHSQSDRKTTHTLALKKHQPRVRRKQPIIEHRARVLERTLTPTSQSQTNPVCYADDVDDDDDLHNLSRRTNQQTHALACDGDVSRQIDICMPAYAHIRAYEYHVHIACGTRNPRKNSRNGFLINFWPAARRTLLLTQIFVLVHSGPSHGDDDDDDSCAQHKNVIFKHVTFKLARAHFACRVSSAELPKPTLKQVQLDECNPIRMKCSQTNSVAIMFCLIWIFSLF